MFFFSSRRRHTRCSRDWSSDVCSSDLVKLAVTSGGVTADSSETKFTWNFGAGLSFAVGSAAVFFESRYVDVAKSFGAAKTSFIPITAGVRFGGKQGPVDVKRRAGRPAPGR